MSRAAIIVISGKAKRLHHDVTGAMACVIAKYQGYVDGRDASDPTSG
jgi:hypothetical protein